VPGLPVIETLQDKISQKKLLSRLGIATAPFLAFKGDQNELGRWIAQVDDEFSGHAVFKWARLGYDGKGTLIGPRPIGQIEDFCRAALSKRIPIFAERRIRFTRELAIVAVRSSHEVLAYPSVISEQRDGIC